MKVTTIQHQQPLEQLAAGGKIGLISLATDFNIEADLQQMYPSDVQFFTSRLKNLTSLTFENLRAMESEISATADTILPGTELGVIMYACTSGTIAIGPYRITELIHEVRPNVPVSTPVTAALSAFQRFNVKKISILTPYTEGFNRELAAFFISQGYEVLNIGGFGFEDDTAMSYISPQDITDAAVASCDPNADLMFISGTALRAAQVIDELEKRLNIPVISSNQALVWHSLELVKYPTGITGFGALLRNKLGVIK